MDFNPLRQYCEEHGEPYRYAKGEYMVEQGELCRWFAVVKSGYFKFCPMASDGSLCVTGFSFVDEVTTDYVHSFQFGKPSLTSIIAGMKTDVMRIPLSLVREIDVNQGHDFFEYVNSILLDEAYRRYLDHYIKTPTERYRTLLERCPKEVGQIPLNDLASYLRVSRRQFLRIRENVMKDNRM